MIFHKYENDPLMELYNSNSINELQNNFTKICQSYFVEKFALAMISKIDMGTQNSNEFSCFHSYPQEWVDRYENEKFYIEDPVYLYSKNISIPHFWHIDKFHDLNENQKKILSECSSFDIKRGTTIPLIPNGKHKGYLTLIDTNIYHPDVLYILTNAAHIYTARKDFFDAQDVFKSLSVKEMLVLSLKAEGRLIKQIAVELGVSDATIIFHLKNIRRKLGSLTTEQAVFKYILSK